MWVPSAPEKVMWLQQIQQNLESPMEVSIPQPWGRTVLTEFHRCFSVLKSNKLITLNIDQLPIKTTNIFISTYCAKFSLKQDFIPPPQKIELYI